MKEDLEDIKLRQLFKNELPEAGHNEWFTKKILNRLPAKQKSSISKIECIGYAIAIIAILTGWVYIFSTYKNDNVISIDEITIAITLLSCLIALIFAMIKPILKF